MVTKLLLRLHSFPLTTLHANLIFPRKHSLPKSLTVSLFSTSSSSQALTQIRIPDTTLSYGPSLHKGYTPQPQQHEQEDCLIDEQDFTRVFDLAALRVPAKDCFALEKRLRGHLLNWPRIRNIARVPGDEVDPELVNLLGDRDEEPEEDLVSLERRIYGKAEGDGDVLSPVLYREKLARTFNSRGYVKFRNLAKISRPTKKKRRRNDDGEEAARGEGKRGIEKNEIVLVEVVEEEEEGGDLKGLLGDEFEGRMRKWRGPTRLLLLDERYSGRKVEDLPEAIKVLLKEDMKESPKSTFELVRCKLTLFYNYWQMNEILEAMLPKDIIVPSAFETVGHVAHLNLREEHLPYKNLIAKLEVLAGNHSLVTTVVENGMRFHVDLATVYWNSRLATERQRLLNGFTRNDVVCDVFTGVGPIAISAAKIVKRVYANDLNPYAVEYLERNCVLNKVERKVEVFNMDGRRFIRAIFASEKAKGITQVVMNLPNDAAEYLDAFRGIFRGRPKNGDFTFPLIHVYGFSKAQDPEFDFHKRIRISLSEVAVDVEMRRVRLVAPGKWMLCASFILPETVGFADSRQDR
ncbi:tRNA (guanine(37)-N1)-methyltransferase 1 isoform X2 [Juglans microcarpa x Juglans regia]|uniref:tRNA (guanine(37)-N1)-methyltransferase 1 isoform X2 n=1 Tax=Juglans microcarpa x Juglans regia TaxID=2249226 RepID=UPI001B7E2609|nr:tRNA (guanine(37)-N1)-methyltransferase 1 isoform X2 [Juglans microcarpa x Juglans regia]